MIISSINQCVASSWLFSLHIIHDAGQTLNQKSLYAFVTRALDGDKCSVYVSATAIQTEGQIIKNTNVLVLYQYSDL